MSAADYFAAVDVWDPDVHTWTPGQHEDDRPRPIADWELEHARRFVEDNVEGTPAPGTFVGAPAIVDPDGWERFVDLDDPDVDLVAVEEAATYRVAALMRETIREVQLVAVLRQIGAARAVPTAGGAR